MQLNDFLPHFAPYISGSVLDDIQKRIGHLPLLTRGGFECHLNENSPTFDFLMAMRRSDVSRFFDEPLAHPDWLPLKQLAQAWLEDSFYEPLTHLWFEFDSDARQPSIFFYNLNPTSQREAITYKSLELLMGERFSDALHGHLKDYFSVLPDHMFLFGVGLPVARKIEAVRMNTHHPDWNEILPLLKNLGWPVDPFLVDLLTQMAELTKYVRLSVDFGSKGMFPKIGFDLHLEEQKKPRLTPQWESLLAWLVKNEWCLPENCEQLKAWFGHHYQEVVVPGVVLRAVNHVKLSYTPGQPLKAKAYLGFFHARLGPTFAFKKFEQD